MFHIRIEVEHGELVFHHEGRML